ncbi:MAG: 2-enoyl thioester reductase domain-containing protein [Terrimicrobiaceae bacterium]|nr:2-enoyl thioester reductase domain-containing protein [Terrimicrobiaceae bacterium]
MPLASRLQTFAAPAEAITVTEVDPRPPGPGEVRLEMLAAPINPADLNVIEGKYGELPELPATIGNEGVGRIAEVGPNVNGLHAGQVVLPLSFGTWAESITVPAANVVALPDDIDTPQAAMLTVNPATAWRILHEFVDLEPGDWVVQNAANSGVGRSTIQLAKALGLHTLNVVRRPELVDELQSAGADAVVLEETDLRKEARALCGGKKPRLALNSVGGASALNVANALAPGGCLVTFGAMSKQPLKIPNGLLIFSNLQFRGFWLKRWRDAAPREEIMTTYEKLAGFVAQGALHTPVHATFRLGQLQDALAEAAAERRGGKVLLDLSAG